MPVDFAAYLLRTEHVLIACAVWILISVLQRLVPDLGRSRLWARLLPVTPIVGCSVAVWLPGLVEGGAWERVLLGIVLGAGCGHIHKIVRQSLLGNDRRIRDHPARL